MTLRLLEDFKGVDPTTGATVSGVDQLLSSVRDILSTRIGSRVMRPTYGCRSADRLDAPLNADTTADLIADTASALYLWEPRLTLKRVVLNGASAAGAMQMDLVVDVNGRVVRLEGVV